MEVKNYEDMRTVIDLIKDKVKIKDISISDYKEFKITIEFENDM